MTAIDHEAEYNNRLRIAEFPAIVARWQATSAANRQSPGAELDQPYGDGERQRYDLFHTGERTAPLVVYIHGGYWQLGERQMFSFLAPAFRAAGLDLAIPSYPLCPAVSILQIIEELRRCLAAIWTRTKKHPVVIGHSAGGHLTAAMLATDWRRVPGMPSDLPADLVRAGCAISGVFELAPLIPTTMNRAMRLDPETARAASPLFWPPPPSDRTLVAAVGDGETLAFHQQSRTMVAAWAKAGVTAEYLSVAGTNHFTVMDELARPDSALLGRVVALARS